MAIDKHYLELQFWDKVYKKNGAEFQSFFWEIMAIVSPDFEPIKPYGKNGDRKNDGFIKSRGIYYQVYSPENPIEKQGAAAQKMEVDFKGLYEFWNEKYSVKEFFFVFNDKNLNIAEPLLSKLSKLEKSYPDIKFTILTPRKFKGSVLNLSDDNLIRLGFSVDSRDSVKIIKEFIDNLEIELDKGNGEFVLNSLEKLEPSLNKIDNVELKLEYEILKCRALLLDGKVSDVITKYTELSKIYPNDSRPLLYLSEIYLGLDDPDKNKGLLDEAEKIDDKSSLLRLEKLIRALGVGESVDLSSIDENDFPQDKRMRSVFYRLYALFYDKEGNNKKADEFIEKAINLNPSRFSNYEAKANILERRKFTEKNEATKKEYYDHLSFLAKKYEEFNNTSKKTKLTLNFRLFIKAIGENDQKSANRLAKEIFDQALQSHFDTTIDQILGSLLESTPIPDLDFQKLLSYLESSTIKISDQLTKALIIQFCANGKLLTKGKKFFEKIDNVSAVQFVEKVSLDKQDELIAELKKDNIFMFLFSSHAKDFPILRKRIIEELPEAEIYDRNKILLAFHYDQNEIDDAYKILLNVDLSESNLAECDLFYKIADQKKDYFLKSKILERWIQIEKNEKDITNLRLSLLETYFYMKKYPDTVKLGRELLKNKEKINEYSTEVVIRFIILSLMDRGEYPEANKFITEMQEQLKTPILKFLEADIFTKNSKGKEALKALVEGVKMQKTPSDEDYSTLYILVISIDSLEKVDIETSENEVTENSFVKLTGSNKWFYIGDDLPLDATKVSKNNPKYVSFIKKKVGESVDFPDDKYSPPENPRSIEKILKIENYIFRQVVDKFNTLAHENRLEGVQVVKVAKTNGKFDPENLINFMKDQSKEKESFFDMYCKNHFPLAFLALNEGGLMNAIGRISIEDSGFIKCMVGTQEEIDKQKEHARLSLGGEITVLDATSALFLAERGLFEKVFKSLPNLKTPHSVINLLLEVSKRFELSPGQVGHMGYKKGQIQYNEAHAPTMNLIRNNILGAIKVIEENPNSILYVPESSVSEAFSEKNIQAELRDACILAQENKGLVLTDDFLYLQANNLETKKGTPKYFSSISIVKTLFEKGSLSLEEYLDYFYYLSSYRVHFLPITTDDLEKAVILNKKGIITIKPENIRLFNPKLTLSEEYGVDPKTVLMIVISFLIRIIKNDSISVENAVKIFEEINSPFLSSYPFFSYFAIEACKKTVENYPKPVGTPPIKRIEQDKLFAIVEKLKAIGIPT